MATISDAVLWVVFLDVAVLTVASLVHPYALAQIPYGWVDVQREMAKVACLRIEELRRAAPKSRTTSRRRDRRELSRANIWAATFGETCGWLQLDIVRYLTYERAARLAHPDADEGALRELADKVRLQAVERHDVLVEDFREEISAANDLVSLRRVCGRRIMRAGAFPRYPRDIRRTYLYPIYGRLLDYAGRGASGGALLGVCIYDFVSTSQSRLDVIAIATALGAVLGLALFKLAMTEILDCDRPPPTTVYRRWRRRFPAISLASLLLLSSVFGVGVLALANL